MIETLGHSELYMLSLMVWSTCRYWCRWGRLNAEIKKRLCGYLESSRGDFAPPRLRSQITLGSPIPPSVRDCRAKGVTLVSGGRLLLVDSPEMFRVFDLGRGHNQSSPLQPSVSLIKRELTQDPAHCIFSLHIIRGDDIVVIFSISLRHDSVYVFRLCSVHAYTRR